ncbi:MAG: hypothetical protein U0800_08695 [Isosphaeraceae bacterium]
MPDRITAAVVCLHISAAIYGIVCLAFLFHPEASSTDVSLFGAFFSVALAVGIEAVAVGLKRRKYWAWVAGVCIFTLYVPTLFFPLGATGLWALLTPPTRAAFGAGHLTALANRSRSSTRARVLIRLLILTVALALFAIAYVQFAGIGFPPYSSIPEPSERDRLHQLVALPLFGIAALSAASLTIYFTVTFLVPAHRRATNAPG